jgi:hypothetical protein
MSNTTIKAPNRRPSRANYTPPRVRPTSLELDMLGEAAVAYSITLTQHVSDRGRQRGVSNEDIRHATNRYLHLSSIYTQRSSSPCYNKGSIRNLKCPQQCLQCNGDTVLESIEGDSVRIHTIRAGRRYTAIFAHKCSSDEVGVTLVTVWRR